MRVILIDDQGDILQMMGEILQEEGYRVVCVHEPEDALRLITRHRFDLIVTDLLVNGNNWQGFVDAVRKDGKNGANLPILVVTGWHNAEEKVGKDIPVLQKPFKFEQLLDAVHALAHHPKSVRPSFGPS